VKPTDADDKETNEKILSLFITGFSDHLIKVENTIAFNIETTIMS
jgi:hypothetical protein